MSEWRIRYHSFTAMRRLWHWRLFATRAEAEAYAQQRALFAEAWSVEQHDADESSDDK